MNTIANRSFSITPAFTGIVFLFFPLFFWVTVSLFLYFSDPVYVLSFLNSLPSFGIVTITVYFPILVFVMAIAAFREVFTRRDFFKNISMLLIALSLFFLAFVMLWLAAMVFG